MREMKGDTSHVWVLWNDGLAGRFLSEPWKMVGLWPRVTSGEGKEWSTNDRKPEMEVAFRPP